MKLYLLPLLLLLLAPLGAQHIVPLMEHAQLFDGRTQTLPAGLAVCGEVDLPGVERIVAGGNNSVKIDLDTAGLGSDLTDYRCIGCETLDFGTVVLRSDTVIYTAFPGTVQGLDTIGLTVCSPRGVCADTTELVFLVQRASRQVELGNVLLQPESVIDLTVPTDSLLPGGAFCRTITGCADDYPGRGQRFAFRTTMEEGNDFRYEAGRFGGTDAVCVTLCNELGLCDTYRATFTVDRPAVELPFFDDFSYEGFRPATSLWQDEDVLVNRSYGVNPPSLGVATFDAIDFDGRPYPSTGNGRRGVPRDYLTSVPLRMSGKTGSVLSFYLQPRGLGNRPEVQDSFLVQFLTATGEWETVFSREGLLSTTSNTRETAFRGELVPVPQEYLYDGFQFRFVNLSTEQGAVDNWNLDYVKLSNQSTSLVTQDLALSEAPFRLVAPYTSLPVRHLQAAGQTLLVDSIFLKLWNHRADVTPVTRSSYEVRNLGQPSFISGAGLFPSSYFGQDNGIAPLSLEIRSATFDQLPTYNGIRSFLFGLDPEGDYRIATTYSLTVATEDPGFSPLIAANNEATQITVLDDYFAYDDGSAEVAIEGQAGNVIVQRYTAFVPDQLVGIRLRLPRGLGSVDDQRLNLVVYGAGEEGTPGELLYSASEPVLYAEDFYTDSLQAFTSYALREPLDLPAGDFYVGWRQDPANRSLPVGFDRNNPVSGVQYFDAGSGWEALNGSTGGAIMIRPLLSGAEVMPTATDDLPGSAPAVQVYPNPTEGAVTLRLDPSYSITDLRFRLLDAAGRTVIDGVGTDRLDLSRLPRGLYLLEYWVGDRVGRHKIVRQ
ncbi:T9SS type A sorting domain-containing protein [Neolewinella litorea]|uniref:T9SS type A sorting domain-containing protein n=1 Tax=Neolewinella litorea TaxID=2562452 RepID=A0A4S4NDY4_9BACT|nr:T9SS type A sorting domain-containing protein [Neolewinella litorea]THH37736.1 T9SS type A sorting domain-containing protein [Neolewinella litorea]